MAQGDQSGQSKLKVHWNLSGPLFLPFSPFLFSPSSLLRSVLTSKPCFCNRFFTPLHPHPFLSLVRTFVRTLACTHTRTCILLTTRFRWPRLVTMRFGSSVVPLHWVLLHRQPHTLFVCLVFLISSASFACTCASHNPLSGQDGGVGMSPFTAGRDGRFPMETDWMEVWTQTSVPAG